MSVETMSRRLSVIEQTWKEASNSSRISYREELVGISSGLGRVTGPEAERAAWLTRRLHRIDRIIEGALD